jgi:hypothetical protein
VRLRQPSRERGGRRSQRVGRWGRYRVERIGVEWIRFGWIGVRRIGVGWIWIEWIRVE